MPISPVLPCAQTGWGLVNLSNIQPIIKHLNGSETLTQRAADVVACMQVNQDAREAYWGAYPSVIKKSDIVACSIDCAIRRD